MNCTSLLSLLALSPLIAQGAEERKKSAVANDISFRELSQKGKAQYG
jgi:hypothetical protein